MKKISVHAFARLLLSAVGGILYRRKFLKILNKKIILFLPENSQVFQENFYAHKDENSAAHNFCARFEFQSEYVADSHADNG